MSVVCIAHGPLFFQMTNVRCFKIAQGKKNSLKVQNGSMDFHVTNYKKTVIKFCFGIAANLEKTTAC